MTTGRINQVANPSGSRGGSLPRVFARLGSPRVHREALLRGSARGSSGGPTDVLARGSRVREELGLHRRPADPSASPADAAVAVVLGTRGPVAHPWAHVWVRAYSGGFEMRRRPRGAQTALSLSHAFRNLGLDAAASQLPGADRSTHWASSSLLLGVRSVDNYGGPVQ